MNKIDFGVLESECPEFKDDWVALRQWFAKNEKKQFVELSLLMEIPNTNNLFLALQLLVDKKMVSVSYRVKAPGGYLLEGDYADSEDIPHKLWDRDHSHRISLNNCSVVVGYKW